MAEEDAPEAPSSRKVVIRVTASIVAHDEEEIGFRYTLLGDRVESPPLLTGEDAQKDWELQDDAWIWTRSHQMDVTDVLIEQIDSQPIVCFFRSEKTKSYAAALHCDISAFLANETRIGAGRKGFHVRMEVEGVLMSPELLKKHNPLRIVVGKVKALPGSRTDSEPLQKYVEDPFQLHRDYCRSAYCVVRPPLGLSRWSASDAREVAATVNFQHTVVYLTGGHKREDLEECLATTPFAIEVHDRDLVVCDEDDIKRLEALPDASLDVWNRVASGELSLATATRAVASTRRSSRASADVAKTPDLADVDALFTKALISSWARAGDDHAYGHADARVDTLLASAPLVAKAFLNKPAAEASRAPPPPPPAAAESEEEEDHSAESSSSTPADDDTAAKSSGGAGENTDTDSTSKKDSDEASKNPEEEEDETHSIQVDAPKEDDFAPCITVRGFVTARKRRIVPKGGTNDWKLNEAQRLAMTPGAYADAGTVVAVTVSLARLPRPTSEGIFYDGGFWRETWGDQPFKLTGEDRLDHWQRQETTSTLASSGAPFSRAFLKFPYSDVGRLRAVLTAIDEINRQGLGKPNVSLRSYQLDKDEMERAEKGDLDVVGGFMIIDAGKSRILVIEGLVASIQKVMACAPRKGNNDDQYRTLADPRCRYTKRLYTAFHTDLKKVRLRDPLAKFAMSPEIYDRSKVDEACFQALNRLVNATKARTLRELSFHDATGLPGAAMILKIESKFGDTINLTDIDGTVGKSSTKGLLSSKSQLLVEEPQELEEEIEEKPKAQPRKAATDAKNPLYEASLKCRTTVDWLDVRKQETLAAEEAYEVQKKQREHQRSLDKVPATYQYSGQKLQYSELKKAEERRRMRLDRNATYVRSTSMEADYVSTTIPLVDDVDQLMKQEAEAGKAKWMTKRGFIYPCPKEAHEYKEHPSKPSQSRVDELREPWEEGAMFGTDLQRDDDPSKNVDPKKNFDTVPTYTSALFGGFEKPTFERDYDGRQVGAFRQKLPRGHDMTGKKDDVAYNRSVHLCGEGLAAEEAEAKRKEKENFESKLVVDTLDVKIGRFVQIDRPGQTDRLRDILHDPPKKLALVKVHNAILPSGKPVPLEPPPYSIFADSEYVDPSNFAKSLRIYSTTSSGGDWTHHFHRDTLRRASERILHLQDRPPAPIEPADIADEPRRWHFSSR